MKKTFRLFALSALVMTALGFSVVGAMALSPVSRAETQSASATSEPKNEVVGTVSAIDAGTITMDGTVYNLATFTKVEGSIQVGDTVKLELITNPDGSLTVNEVNKTDSTRDSSMDGTSTEPASTEPAGTETPSPEHGSTSDMNGPSLDNGNGSINGTRQDGSGNSTDPVSHNSQGRDSGSGSSQGHDTGNGSDGPTGKSGN